MEFVETDLEGEAATSIDSSTEEMRAVAAAVNKIFAS